MLFHKFDNEVYAKRRAKLRQNVSKSIIIIPSFPTNHHYVAGPYRQRSHLAYLTGFTDENCILVLRPGMSPECVMFVRPRNDLEEYWEGARPGPLGAKNTYGIDEAYSIEEFSSKIGELMNDVEQIFYKFGENLEIDRLIHQQQAAVQKARGRTGVGLMPLLDPSEIIGELRLFKGPEEIANMKRAAQISCEAHKEAMRFTRPGVYELQVEAVLRYKFMSAGAHNMAYGAIVGSGANATTLHYHANDSICKDGELLLIDAGCDWGFYASDITRTFPVNGKFSPVQKDVYQAVLSTQKALIAKAQVGVPYNELQFAAIDGISQSLIDLGLIRSTSKNEIVDKKLYREFYPHNIGHWLGMDVHDAGLYYANQSRKLEPGMVLTIEPGIYIRPDNQNVASEFRGIGVRIEDDIHITPYSNENLTQAVPKEVGEIEAICAETSSFS